MKRLSAALALLAAPLLAQGPLSPPPAAVPKAPPAAPAGTIVAHPAMWVVRDADTTIYLLGTVHMLDPKYRWFEGTVKTGFGRSRELVIETITPPPAEAQPIVLDLAVDPDGPPLTQKLGAELGKRFSDELVGLGLPAAAFDRYEPWFAGVTLSVLALQHLGMKAEAGVETTLIALAATAGKRVSGLEGFREQLGFLDTLPEADQIDFVRVSLDEANDVPAQMNALVAAWARGDVTRVAALMNEGMEKEPVLRKRLLDDRNARWVTWVRARMTKPGAVFLAVGAGHVAGPAGLPALLAKAGVKVERMRT